jgi:putative DeoR family transcriptional regulator (stage III sporulation protein D)
LKEYIEERVVATAQYIIKYKATVREAAKVFKVSKSTVHKDMSERLPKINPILYNQVKKIVDKNKAERHIRGGRATKLKYIAKKI